MRHFLKNILILDRERCGRSRQRRDGEPRALSCIDNQTIQSLDILLIEETAGYWIEKNRYGSMGCWIPRERLPEFLLDPTKSYERLMPADYGIVERVPTIREVGCTCHLSTPCSFCISLNEEEADIMASSGQEALQQYWREMANV
jgi:hypothetical protein